MKKFLKSILLAGFVLAVAASAAQADDAPPKEDAVSAEKKPQQVRVGVYVLNIGKFDVSSGAFSVDFYLSMTSDASITANSFEFMNGHATSIETITDDPKEKFYRIRADLFQNVDLKAYPFDTHTLRIEIEEKSNGTDKVVYVPDNEQSGIDELVTFVGWELAGKPRAVVTVHDYPIYKEKYSRFEFEMQIRRTALAAVLKAFLPVAFILLVGLLSLIIKADNVGLRFGLNTSILLAAVMFHLTITSTLPPVGYLTFADRFMIVTYVSLILCLASTLLLMRHTEKGEETRAKWIFGVSLTFVPLITIGMFVLLFVLSLLA